MAFPDPYQKLEERIVHWAQRRTAVYAILRIGSRARRAGPADAWSDLDLLVLAADPEQFAGDPAWLSAFGEVLAPVFQRHHGSDFEWLVLFADGLKADFYVTEAGVDLTAVITHAPFRHVLQRGVDVLYVRPDLTITLPPAGPEPGALPTAAAFQHEIQAMLLAAFKAAKFVRRDDLWRARLLLDGEMRAHLLTMIEWHARALFGPERDTWYNGRYLEDWADPRVLAALPNTYGRFTPQETWRALFAMLILFRWLAEETAGQRRLEFPQHAADQVWAWIQELYLTNPTAGI